MILSIITFIPFYLIPMIMGLKFLTETETSNPLYWLVLSCMIIPHLVPFAFVYFQKRQAFLEANKNQKELIKTEKKETVKIEGYASTVILSQ